MYKHIAAGLLLVSIAGCGNQLGKTTLAEARKACEEQNEAPISDDLWDTLVIQYSEMPSVVPTRAEALTRASAACDDVNLNPTREAVTRCNICVTKLVDATWD